MKTMLFDDDVIPVIKEFFLANSGDEDTQSLILAIGADILDVSDDTMLEMIL